MSKGIVGKYIVKIFDRNNSLVDERESYNIITTLGRNRILDIWSMNYSPTDTKHKNLYGIEEIDMTPTAVTGGTRKCTMFNTGYMHNNEDNSSSYNYNAYDSYITGSTGSTTLSDNIFINSNTYPAYWDQGAGMNQNPNSYKHSIDLCRVDTNESVTVTYAGANYSYQLIGTNIKFDHNSDQRNALKVMNSSETITYNIGTDYTYNRTTGVITFIYGGSISNGQNVHVIYKWHQTSYLSDGVIGMSMRAWTRQDYDCMFDGTQLSQGRYSADGGELWLGRCMPWGGKPLSQQYYYSVWDWNYWTDANSSSAEHVDWRFVGQYDHYYFTYPYIMNKPTNLSFNASFYWGPLYISNWRFFKPRYQPQAPQCLALGTGSATPTIGDTALQTEVLRLNLLSGTRPSNGLGRWTAYLGFDEGIGTTFNEIGLFYGDEYRNSSASGWSYFAPIKKANCTNLFSRSVYSPGWSKTADQRVELTYELLLS